MSRSRPRCPALCIQWRKAITIPLCQGSGEQLARTLPLDRKRLLIWDEPASLTHTGLSSCRQLCLKAGRWVWVTRAKTRRHAAAQGLPSNGPWHHYSKYLFYCSLKKYINRRAEKIWKPYRWKVNLFWSFSKIDSMVRHLVHLIDLLWSPSGQSHNKKQTV